MVKIKICGITEIDDALHAVDCGVDALGFVFYERSPRAITPDKAQAIIAKLPPFVTVVGLFVNEDPRIVQEVADHCHLDVIQYHGDETPEIVRKAPRRSIRALRIREDVTFTDFNAYPASGILIDAWVAGAFGGTGVLSSWEIAAEIAKQRPLILAGGLTPENVAAAIQTVRPYGVDVSSGVEDAPGRKDRKKVAAFIKGVHHSNRTTIISEMRN
ncbi:MAG: phosphoribosylanthranilate isomerase [Deltaproteobacteria bacterium HGW-Deltaproteobacteria-4]|nr:MAG: phosphoribosylanthranilate isomerase [Deltaproteobacteria bacterium HGW-Deltaproteobacteria-4]